MSTSVLSDRAGRELGEPRAHASNLPSLQQSPRSPLIADLGGSRPEPADCHRPLVFAQWERNGPAAWERAAVVTWEGPRNLSSPSNPPTPTLPPPVTTYRCRYTTSAPATPAASAETATLLAPAARFAQGSQLLLHHLPKQSFDRSPLALLQQHLLLPALLQQHLLLLAFHWEAGA